MADRIDLEKIIGEKSYEFYLANKKPVNVVVAILAILLIGIVGYKFIYIDRIFNPKQKNHLKPFGEQKIKHLIMKTGVRLFMGILLAFMMVFLEQAKNMKDMLVES